MEISCWPWMDGTALLDDHSFQPRLRAALDAAARKSGVAMYPPRTAVRHAAPQSHTGAAWEDLHPVQRRREIRRLRTEELLGDPLY